MGNILTPPSSPIVTRRERQHSKSLDKEIKRDFNQQCDIIKLLLLGTENSGKSTLFQQMKVRFLCNSIVSFVLMLSQSFCDIVLPGRISR
jgi:hypothetical protein